MATPSCLASLLLPCTFSNIYFLNMDNKMSLYNLKPDHATFLLNIPMAPLISTGFRGPTQDGNSLTTLHLLTSSPSVLPHTQFTLLWPSWPPYCSSIILGMLEPQSSGFSCCLCLDYSFLFISMPYFFNSLPVLLKCHYLNEP